MRVSAKTKRDGQTGGGGGIAISPGPGPMARREIIRVRNAKC